MNKLLDGSHQRAPGRASTALPGNLNHATINIGDVLTERSNPLGNQFADQPRLVVVGLNFACLPDMGDFAVPMMFFAFHAQPDSQGS